MQSTEQPLQYNPLWCYSNSEATPCSRKHHPRNNHYNIPYPAAATVNQHCWPIHINLTEQLLQYPLFRCSSCKSTLLTHQTLRNNYYNIYYPAAATVNQHFWHTNITEQPLPYLHYPTTATVNQHCWPVHIKLTEQPLQYHLLSSCHNCEPILLTSTHQPNGTTITVSSIILLQKL